MIDKPTGWARALDTWLWRTPLERASAAEAILLGLLRLAFVLVRDLAQGQLTLRAMSLVYTTLLSLVPLLALSFSVLKAFGVHNQVAPVLLAFLAPLGDQSALVTERIIEFIGKLNVGVLGSIGLALLIYTVVSLLQKIEESVNYIWHITTLRGFARRFSGYLSVLLIGPVLVFALIGATRALSRTEPVRDLLTFEPLAAAAHALATLLPLVGAIAIFTLAYALVPNTRVRLGAALTGGAVAGVLWHALARAFAAFAAGSTQYAAIYSSLAILILFLIWLYINWLVLLLGASIAFYRQRPEYLIVQPGEPRLSNRMRERVALTAMFLVAKAYHDGAAPWTLERLTQHLGVPMHGVDAICSALQRSGLLAVIDGDVPSYVPARDLQRIEVSDVLASVRAAGEDRFVSPETLQVPDPVGALLQGLEQATADRLGDLTLRELVTSGAVEIAGVLSEST